MNIQTRLLVWLTDRMNTWSDWLESQARTRRLEAKMAAKRSARSRENAKFAERILRAWDKAQ